MPRAEEFRVLGRGGFGVHSPSVFGFRLSFFGRVLGFGFVLFASFSFSSSPSLHKTGDL